MGSLKIGVMIESFRLGVKRGIEKAAEIGADGFQIFATSGEIAPENLSWSGRADFLHLVESLNLKISALCGDFGGHGLGRAADNNWKVKKTKKIMDLARDLKTNVVTTHIGVISQDDNSQAWRIMQEACEDLGKYGDEIGIYLAIETGPEKVETLRKFLESLKSESIKVNYDPANLVMVTGDDATAGVHILKDYIVHTHAKDGVRLKPIEPQVVYDYFAEGGIENLRLEEYFKEKPLGQGDVDFDTYIGALREIGYDGFFTIEREVGDDPLADIIKAKNFLDRY